MPKSDIVAELHQAEMETYSSFGKTCQLLGKEVIVHGKQFCHMAAPTPASSSRVGCKEIGVSEESLHQKLDRKKLDVAKFLSGFTTNDPGEQEALNDHLDYLGIEIPCMTKASLEEEDPKEEEDPGEFPLKFRRFSRSLS
ncbi:hypothetical protein FNV43_RR04332 [Rhamnella rubrinervis]|uniref:Uncharacterized protein n=1 Tax=Rhamnella rubrinervis TaxID=2594499 RepID=A0A8K0MPG8_9ROSA|nr:hypothetical protein FNV43_RR04332 [Rhamnella rubrinervis]